MIHDMNCTKIHVSHENKTGTSNVRAIYKAHSAVFKYAQEVFMKNCFQTSANSLLKRNTVRI